MPKGEFFCDPFRGCLMLATMIRERTRDQAIYAVAVFFNQMFKILKMRNKIVGYILDGKLKEG